MRKALLVISILLFTYLLLGFAIKPKPQYTHTCNSTWGFYGHKKINRLAIFTLPPELFPLYKKHIEYLTDHAVDPDKRRYAVKGEAERHFIDIDHYVKPGEDPFEIMPERWYDAVEKFSEDTLRAYGIVPWHLQTMLYRLKDAFEAKDLNRILKVSAEFGHYIGDAHVPLHTTENYNGQMTGQKGIHGFWESRLPELFSEDYDLFVGQAKYIERPLDKIWDIIKGSHYALDSVFDFERQLTEFFGSDRKYAYEQRGAVMMKTYSKEFSQAYHEMLDGMVERRMYSAIYHTGSFWYTAWKMAGEPNINDIMNGIITFSEEEEVDSLPENKKIKTREHDN